MLKEKVKVSLVSGFMSVLPSRFSKAKVSSIGSKGVVNFLRDKILPPTSTVASYFIFTLISRESSSSKKSVGEKLNTFFAAVAFVNVGSAGLRVISTCVSCKG